MIAASRRCISRPGQPNQRCVRHRSRGADRSWASIPEQRAHHRGQHFFGPYAQRPLEHGADLVVYSATKYFGGHDDLVAGVVAGANDLIEPMKTMRYRIGTTADPHTAWLLGRSLETYAIRVERQTATAARWPGSWPRTPRSQVYATWA